MSSSSGWAMAGTGTVTEMDVAPFAGRWSGAAGQGRQGSGRAGTGGGGGGGEGWSGGGRGERRADAMQLAGGESHGARSESLVATTTSERSGFWQESGNGEAFALHGWIKGAAALGGVALGPIRPSPSAPTPQRRQRSSSQTFTPPAARGGGGSGSD
ncbi:hypothetical protein EJ04DRAFT_522367 [Polyplosphaeria fusca]|uniref:Uncharacterized protein n=1 Tax=Polyplosphaeria fusca TaxID=682080 RepID=A0A9P4R3E7_9PLEO|nr:hypothetical protein EJ04DRAFT_522367 [Polyplosphaeria fusca]